VVGPLSQIHLLYSHSFTTLFPSVMTNLSLSTLSLNSTGSDSQNEDWDRFLEITDEDMTSENTLSPLARTTPRNSVVFPADETPGRIVKTGGGHGRDGSVDGKGKRTLSELMKMHAERGTNCQFSVEEASRVADVLGQWINASSSPYESEDDFFVRSQDDLFILPKRSPLVEGRPRGQSESNSRPPSSTGFVAS